jgi:hypothetical protein
MLNPGSGAVVGSGNPNRKATRTSIRRSCATVLISSSRRRNFTINDLKYLGATLDWCRDTFASGVALDVQISPVTKRLPYRTRI